MGKSKPLPNATYLGDGAYVDSHDAFSIRLFTSDGVQITNQVFLEVDGIYSFFDWLKVHHHDVWESLMEKAGK